VLADRYAALDELEQQIAALREGAPAAGEGAGQRRTRSRGRARAAGEDLTIKLIIGGVREVASARLRRGRANELPGLAEDLATWVVSYPPHAPAQLLAPRRQPGAARRARAAAASARARRASGRLPSGRSDTPPRVIRDSQRERIVDAIAAIVTEHGLEALTIPDIAKRAEVSLATFYALYGSKHEAFIGAQKVGMHQALAIGVQAFDEQMPDWPRAVGAGLHALVEYLVAEPEHAHLSIVDTFGATPEASETRERALASFAAYLEQYRPRARRDHAPSIATEAIVGGCWQVFHDYVERGRIDELPGAVPQLTYLVLTPFLGPRAAAAAAVEQAHTVTDAG
jgi:AcrR family transcriptional regulator